jgi:hypothetical protein
MVEYLHILILGLFLSVNFHINNNPIYTFNAEGTYTVDLVFIDRRFIAGKTIATGYVAGQLFGCNPL